MTQDNVVRFPRIPRSTGSYDVSPSKQCEIEGSAALRLKLEEIIETAYSGLRYHQEMKALARIDELLNLTINVG